VKESEEKEDNQTDSARVREFLENSHNVRWNGETGDYGFFETTSPVAGKIKNCRFPPLQAEKIDFLQISDR
jgi:hypothetical protein